jgi:riboflavin kinase/FMN adenylyltransferase
MRVDRGLPERVDRGLALTIGNFDGLHLGHAELIRRVREHAARLQLDPAVLTFEPHPRSYFDRAAAPCRLTPLAEKLRLLCRAGVARTVVARFNAAFAAIRAEDFVPRVLVERLRCGALVVGDDFRFGAGRAGDQRLLATLAREQGIALENVAPIFSGGQRVSSSTVRAALARGDLAAATRLLGRPFCIAGRVVHGMHLGRSLGFPTANLPLRVVPPPLIGIFAVQARTMDGAPHRGVASLGYRPAVLHDAPPLLEVHLFDFDRDLYGSRLEVDFLVKVRDERSFENLDLLRQQIARDAESARRYFADQDDG